MEKSTLFAIEMISAVLGSGKEYFGMDSALNANAAPVWLPYTTIEQLIMELEYNSHDPIYHKVTRTLNKFIYEADPTVTAGSDHYFHT